MLFRSGRRGAKRPACEPRTGSREIQLVAGTEDDFRLVSVKPRGDGTEFWICNGCGRIPIYNEEEGLFVCPTCDGPLEFSGNTAESLTMQLPTKQSRVTFSRVAMPYTMKLLDQEMASVGNMGLRFVTEGTIGRARDQDWPWPTEDVEFKVEERGVEAEDVNPEARAAAEAAAAGGDLDAVERAAQEAVLHTQTFALLKTVDFAVRGGRVPARARPRAASPRRAAPRGHGSRSGPGDPGARRGRCATSRRPETA